MLLAPILAVPAVGPFGVVRAVTVHPPVKPPATCGGPPVMSTVTKAKKKSSDAVKIQPLGDRVVVEREESESKTAGGIVLPDIGQGQALARHRHQRRRRPAVGRRQAQQAASEDRRQGAVHLLRRRDDQDRRRRAAADARGRHSGGHRVSAAGGIDRFRPYFEPFVHKTSDIARQEPSYEGEIDTWPR